MSNINQIIAKIAARAATKAAQLHAQAESKFNGVYHIPENIGLRFEAKGLEELSSMLTRLVNVLDEDEPAAAEPAPTSNVDQQPVPILPFKIVSPQVTALTAKPEDNPNSMVQTPADDSAA